MGIDELHQLEKKLEDLKVSYEKFFLGLERRQPSNDHKIVSRQIILAAENRDQTAVERFRSQSLKARLVSYEHYWNRILREMEQGIFSRQRFKQKIQQPVGSSTTNNKASSTEGHDRPYQDVVLAYQQAQKAAGQPPMDEQKLITLLKQQEAKLQQQFQGKQIQFRVTLEDGKPKLKAKPVGN